MPFTYAYHEPTVRDCKPFCNLGHSSRLANAQSSTGKCKIKTSV